jgi:hypothetical protein
MFYLTGYQHELLHLTIQTFSEWASLCTFAPDPKNVRHRPGWFTLTSPKHNANSNDDS